MTNRSFIIDFGCCLPFGHHIQSVRLHHEQEEQKGRAAVSLVCRRVRSFLKPEEENVSCILPALYRELLVDAESGLIKRSIMRVLNPLLYFGLGKRNALDLLAYFSVRKLFKKFRFSSSDYILFPSADFYGVRAFVERLAKHPPDERPRVHFRFIGVLEHAHHAPRDSLYILVSLINRNHAGISVGAEVPVYARYLQTVMPDISVQGEPYPLENRNLLEKKNEEPFTILLPGTNRRDKGYFDLFRLAKEIFFDFPRIKLVVQDMKKWDRDFDKKYKSKLERLANVELVDAIIPRDTLEKLYAAANLVLLPYDPEAYYYRGSSIHYEAITRGIPVLARKGSGFVEEIESWSTGWTYETRQELFARLAKILEYSADDIREKMNTAQENFKGSK